MAYALAAGARTPCLRYRLLNALRVPCNHIGTAYALDLYICPCLGRAKICTSLQVDTRKELASGSEQEIEIRACTVMAVEHLRDALAARYGASAAPDGRHAASTLGPSAASDSASEGEPTSIMLPS